MALLLKCSMVPLPKFIIFIFFLFCISSCEKHENDVNGSPSRGPLQLSALVKNKVYTNERNIKLDASLTSQINGQRKLSFGWACKLFPVGNSPKINGASSAVASIDSLVIGKYHFQLIVKDDFGHQLKADYAMEVFQDTLSGKNRFEGIWVYVQDDWDGHLQLTIKDPVNFAGRTPLNTSITVWDVETQTLINNFYSWSIDDVELIIHHSDFKFRGKKAGVKVNY